MKNELDREELERQMIAEDVLRVTLPQQLMREKFAVEDPRKDPTKEEFWECQPQ